MALKVPVAAVHCGFGGGSTNTEDTSVLLESNSSASSGIASLSVTLCGGAFASGACAGAGDAGGGFCGGVGSLGGEAAGAAGAGSTLSSELGPSSASRASALNTLEQRPQRT